MGRLEWSVLSGLPSKCSSTRHDPRTSSKASSPRLWPRTAMSSPAPIFARQRFTMDRILAFNDKPASRYHGLIDGAKISLGRRSLGGATVLLTVYNTRSGEPRIRAAFCGAHTDGPLGRGPS